MDQHGKTVSELLRILGAIVSYWLIAINFGFPSLHAPILCHYGGIADDACLQAEPVEMVLLHDCGDAMDVGNLCQVHRTYHAKPHHSIRAESTDSMSCRIWRTSWVLQDLLPFFSSWR